MSTHKKWSVLPAALLMMGTLAMAQSQASATQGSTSSNSAGPLTAIGNSTLEPKGAGIYGDATADRLAAVDTSMLIANREVNEAIDNLSRAFANRDVEAFKQLWPSIPERPYAALGKTLNYFKSVSRNFRPESIDVKGDTAMVAGTYSGSFVNGTTVIPSSGKFHATLKQAGTQWVVVTLVCK